MGAPCAGGAVLALAALGLAVTAMTVAGAWRELAATERVARSIRACEPRPLGDAWVVPDERPRAFCAGLIRSRVYVSSGAVALLDEPALRAVLADESAVAEAPANRSALARAMLSFSDRSGPDEAVGIAPARVDYLLGDPPSWRFPVLLCVGALSLIALLAAAGMLAEQLATGATSLAPPFLSSQPCVVVLAAIPSVLGLVALRLRSPIQGSRYIAGVSSRGSLLLLTDPGSHPRSRCARRGPRLPWQACKPHMPIEVVTGRRRNAGSRRNAGRRRNAGSRSRPRD